MPIFGGGKDSPDTVTHINRNVPEWVEAGGKELHEKAKATLGKPREARVYPMQRVAPLTGPQGQAKNNIWSTYGKFEPQIQEVGNFAREQYNRPNERVSTGRFTDPNSQFDQYVAKIYNPMEQRLNQIADRSLAKEQLSNAYAGRGNSSIGKQREDALNQQRQDQLAMLQANVLNQANQYFQSDENRLADVNKANQTAGLQDKMANLKAAETLANSVLSQYNMNAQDIARLMGVGEVEQMNHQKALDESREIWNELQNYDRTELEWLAKMLGQNTGGTMTSSTSQPGPNQALQYAGAALPLISNFAK